MRNAGSVALALAVALGCYVGARYVPLISPLLTALLVGILLANLGRISEALLPAIRPTKILLQLGVGLIGFRLSLPMLAEVGWRGIAVVVATVLGIYFGTVAMARATHLRSGLGLLIASGFAICGAAAIATVENGIRRRNADVALSLALVTLFGSLLIPLIPLLASLAGFDELRAGIWAGASIHEVAQVVAAASITGGTAVGVATTIKLARVLLLGVAFWWSVRLDQKLEPDPLSSTTESRRVSLVPWFVVVFLISVAIRSTGIVPPGALTGIDAVATILLAAGMFGLGLGINVRQLFPLPLAVLGVASVSTLIGVAVPFVLITLLY